MRSRRVGNSRNRTLPPKKRVRHSPDENRHNSYTSHTSQIEERRLERHNATHYSSQVEERLSPPRGHERFQKIRMNDLRSRSIERKDYGRGSSAERKDYGRHFDGHKSKDQYDERIVGRNSPLMEYSWKYHQMAETTTNLNGEVIDGLKHASDFESTMSIINRERASLGSGSSTLDGHGMLVPKSSHLDDGIARALYKLHSDDSMRLNSGRSGDNILSSSSVNSNVGLYKGGFLYRDYQNQTKIPSREYYKEEEKMFSSSDFPYSMMPMSPSMDFQSTSSTLRKEESLAATTNCLPFPSGGLRDYNLKISDPFIQDQCNGGAPNFKSATQPKDVIYPHTSLSSSGGEHREYGYLEIQRREKDNIVHPSDELHRKRQPYMEGFYENRVSTRKHPMELDVDTVSDLQSSHRRLAEGSLWDHQSLGKRPVPNYLNMSRKLVKERDIESLSTGSKYLEFGERVSSDHESCHPKGGYGFGMETGAGFYKERLKTSPRVECEQDIRKFDIDVSHQQSLKVEEVDKYDLSGRAQKRNYDMEKEMSSHDHRSTSSISGDISTLVDELTDISEQWAGEDPDALPSSKPSAFSRLQPKKIKMTFDGKVSPRVSASQRVSSHVQGFATNHHNLNGQKMNIKKPLRPVPVNVQGPNHLDRRQDFCKPDKSRKRSLSAQHGRVIGNSDAPSEAKALAVKAEPPVASKEFKQLIHKAFLRFSKHLNETSAQRRRYKEQGKAGSLLCCVCGSNSKEFADTRSLVSHSFSSSKIDLRADHLGLHKALCVLMGWGSDVVTGNTWVHKVLPNAEALALKENLILWPPLVIIHNSSIGYRNPDAQKVVTIEGMEAILRDLGFSTGTAKVCRGKPANQSIMVVKFLPTFSGLQEAERLHRHYAVNKRGREEFQQITTNSDNIEETRGAHVDNLELVLYGYLGISDDLDKLEIETKKRCVVKSKKDIQTIADASLTTN